MPSEQSRSHEYGIFPLSFLQVYQAAGSFIDALKERDHSVQQWFGSSPAFQRAMTATAIPLYYHWFTSGYGAFDNLNITGWMFLRGWRQVLYVEGLAALPEWRHKGVGLALMQFAEQQGRELHREWLGLTVTQSNAPAVGLYEKLGYQHGHSRVLLYEHASPLVLPLHEVMLRPLLITEAKQAFLSFAEHDLQASNLDTAVVQTRLLEREPHRTITGQHWVLHIDGKPAAYLHKHGSPTTPTIYMAGQPDTWAHPHMIAALARIAGNRATKLTLRLASSAHHNAMCDALTSYGLEERPAATIKMFKHLI